MANSFPLQFEIDGICFDLEDGIASVPNVMEIDHRGFVAYVRPAKFLEACAVGGRDDLTWLSETIVSGRPIGMSFLTLSWVDGSPVVVGHEGRSRMKVLSEIRPDVEFPVAIFLAGGRARHLTEELILSASEELWAEAEDGVEERKVRGPLFDRYRWLGEERSLSSLVSTPSP